MTRSTDRTRTTQDVASTAAETVANHRRRRYLLYCLYGLTEPLSLATVADRLTRWELDAQVREESQTFLRHRLHVYNALYHDHLPELCDSDVVEYDQAEDAVKLDTVGESIRFELTSRYEDEIRTLLDYSIQTDE